MSNSLYVWARNVNLDSLFSYQTVKFVKIRDRRLGILHYTLQLGIFLYIVVYTIFIQKRYLRLETPIGAIRATVQEPPEFVDAALLPYCAQNRSSYMNFKNYNCTYLLGLDVTYPPAQLDSLFISTRIKDTYYNIPTTCTEDVPTNFACAPSKIASTAYRYFAASIEQFTIYMEHSIFGRLNDIQVTNRDCLGEMNFRNGSKNKVKFEDPARGGDIVSLQTILNAADISSLNDPSGLGNSYRYDGALIMVVIIYSNEVLHPDRIHYKYTLYTIPKADVLSFGPSTVVSGARLQRNWYGVRLAFIIAGSIGQFDFPTLLTALVNGIVLVKLSTVIVDALLLFALPKKHIYMKHKFELTEEFGRKRSKSTEEHISSNMSTELSPHLNGAELKDTSELSNSTVELNPTLKRTSVAIP